MLVPCLHCGEASRLTGGREVYPHRPDLRSKKFWKCDRCDASCGCHPGGVQPLGFPANKETRQARMKLHNQRLDPLWRTVPRKQRNRTRGTLYAYMADCMGIPREKTHTGMFTIEQCRKAWECLGKITPEILAAMLKGTTT